LIVLTNSDRALLATILLRWVRFERVTLRSRTEALALAAKLDVFELVVAQLATRPPAESDILNGSDGPADRPGGGAQ